nr:uncharacterized protein LOC109420029 isoform X2 [Aedes albopictus]
MEESHHRNIMDHLDMGSGGHHLQDDLSKGVLRTIHNVENGTLHFITIPPASNSREQEYIESSLLGADLLSSHIPNGMLVDYISNPGPPTPSSQYHQPAANILDHHNNGIQTYTAEDLQTLVDASSLQTSESDRKLFLQFVNKPPAQLSHEAPVIVTNPKDLSSVNTLTEHDKLAQSAHSQALANVSHMTVPASANSFIHYHHQDQLLSTTHSNVPNLNGTGNVLNSHHGPHHHQQQHHSHPHHHHSHQIIQNTAQLQQQPTLIQTPQQQPTQQLLSSIHPMLQNDCTPAKLFHVSSSAPVSTNISINTSANQNQPSYQLIQNTTQLQQQPTVILMPQQQPKLQILSSIHPVLQNVSTPIQLFHVSSSTPVSTNVTFNASANQNDQLLDMAHSNVDRVNGTENAVHDHQPHLHQDHSHQIIQNTAQLQQKPTLVQTPLQQPTQQLSSSNLPMLQNDNTTAKLFHVSSSAPVSSSVSINTSANQNCITIPPLAPIRRVESPKRYVTYQMNVRSSSDVISTESFISREDLIDCEPRSDEDEDHEPATINTPNTHFANNYLPHKKRLAKKLGDPKSTNPADPQFLRNTVISNDHQNVPDRCIGKETSKQFACQLCSVSFEDQLDFFTHLKGHYEPPTESPNDEGKSSDPKKKPKLPRVKHTKKLKNDKSSKVATEDESRTSTYHTNNQSSFVPQATSDTDNKGAYQQTDQLSAERSVLNTGGTDLETTGEFSETEDMLEGIRNVVQKVQEAVDTDTNDGLSTNLVDRNRVLTSGSVDDKAWFQSHQQQLQQQSMPVTADQSCISKPIGFGNSLDAEEIHINTGNENFVLFINKGDYQDQDMASQQNTAQHHLPPPNRQPSNTTILSHTMHQPTHDPSTSYMMGTEPSLPQTTSTIGECDMNGIQILDLGSNVIENHEIAKLVDFNLTTPTPHMNALPSGAKFVKDPHSKHGSIAVGNNMHSEHDQEEFYLSEDDVAEDDDASDEDPDEAVLDEGQKFKARVDPVHDVSVITTCSSAPPGKQKGRKKIHGNEPDEPLNENETKKVSKKYPCAEPDCDKVFNSKTAVRYHELQHKNERPFSCSECPKNFFTSSALKVHERLHSGEKPYKCDECGRAFRQWGDMKYHQASIHSNEKTHQCEFCGKKFARRYSLVLHRKIHLNEKNHVCDICNKAFRASSYLQSHRMIHTGEKPHTCKLCQKKFRCGGDLKRHLKIHDRTKPTSCSKLKTTVQQGEEESSSVKTTPKVVNTSTPKTTKKQSANSVIDLTKIKNEDANKTWSKQTPVVTVLTKDINNAVGGSGSRIASSSSTGGAASSQLIYLTPAAGDQFRKPEGTVFLTDMGRW